MEKHQAKREIAAWSTRLRPWSAGAWRQPKRTWLQSAAFWRDGDDWTTVTGTLDQLLSGGHAGLSGV